MPNYKFLTPQQLQDMGILQEINRQVLNPRGLTLALHVDDFTKQPTGIAGIINNLDKTGGVIFGKSSKLDPRKQQVFDALLEDRAPLRKENLGWVIQPIK